MRPALISLTLLLSSCALVSEPGPKYHVKVTGVQTLQGGSPYCNYTIQALDADAAPPRLYFLAACDRYNVGDEIFIEMNDMK